jgi:hypothetical protein
MKPAADRSAAGCFMSVSGDCARLLGDVDVLGFRQEEEADDRGDRAKMIGYQRPA